MKKVFLIILLLAGLYVLFAPAFGLPPVRW